MDFSFSDEQSLLKDSVERFIQNDYAFDARQKLVKSEPGFSSKNWRTFAELGWLGVPFAESDGGFGGGPIETMLIMEQFGRGLVVEPFVPTVVLAGGMIRLAGNRSQKEKYLARIVDGSLQGAFAFAEPQGRFNLADLTTTATKTDGGYVLNGHKAVVVNGPSADVLVVSARTSGQQRSRSGITLFLVEKGAVGITRRDYPTVDALRASEVHLDNVAVPKSAVLGRVGKVVLGKFPKSKSVVEKATQTA